MMPGNSRLGQNPKGKCNRKYTAINGKVEKVR